MCSQVCKETDISPGEVNNVRLTGEDIGRYIIGDANGGLDLDVDSRVGDLRQNIEATVDVVLKGNLTTRCVTQESKKSGDLQQ